MDFDWSLAGEITRVLAGVVALLGAPFAYLSYRRSVRTKRAEWLASLHDKFFETDRYAQVRRLLDYHEEPQYSDLVRTVTSGTHSPLADEFYRYLNFFELLASLRQLGEISNNEILGLFEYDLTMLTKHQFVLDALPAQGFDRLPQLLQATRLLPAR